MRRSDASITAMGGFPIKQVFVNQINPGDQVDEIFIINRIDVNSYSKGQYLVLHLADKTGEIIGKVWDNAQEVAAAIEGADFVKVSGVASVYNNRVEINIKTVTLADAGEVNKNDFLPITPLNRNEMMQKIWAVVKEIKNENLKALLEAFFKDREWVISFGTAPAAKKNHQPYIGGLLEHTWNMIRMVPALAAVYPVDTALLYAGVILHDIGKIKEYEYEAKIDFSDPGRFLGHIIIGIEEVEKRIASIPGFPEELRLKLLHMVASHHGKPEWGSPVKPAFLEANLLHHLDLLDSEVYHFVNQGNGSANIKWEWCRPLERYVFRGTAEEEVQDESERQPDFST